jgi:imidazolonepropionase-like amidohydrolase
VIPGIIDCHVHLCGILSQDSTEWVLEHNKQQAIVSTVQAEKMLQYGVTTVGDVSENGIYLKKLVQNKRINGPNIFSFGRGFSKTGGYIDYKALPSELINTKHPWGILCDGASDLRKEVRGLVRKGVDGIKVWATGAGARNMYDNDIGYSPDEMKMIVDEALMMHMPVFAHAESLSGIKVALKAGVDGIIHGEDLDEEAIHLMKNNNTTLIPTLKILIDWLDYSYDSAPYRPEYHGDSIENIKNREKERIKDNFVKAYRKGVNIALGSDTFCESVTPYGVHTLGELVKMVEMGMKIEDALRAATINGAKLLGIDHERGSVEIGKFADIVVLEANPFDDIKNISSDNIFLVMKEGHCAVMKGDD